MLFFKIHFEVVTMAYSRSENELKQIKIKIGVKTERHPTVVGASCIGRSLK